MKKPIASLLVLGAFLLCHGVSGLKQMEFDYGGSLQQLSTFDGYRYGNYMGPGGYYRFYYSLPESSRGEERTVSGEVNGHYAFVAPEGDEYHFRYQAGDEGYTVESNALPQPPQDTEEVRRAKEVFFAAYQRALEMADSDESDYEDSSSSSEESDESEESEEEEEEEEEEEGEEEDEEEEDEDEEEESEEEDSDEDSDEDSSEEDSSEEDSSEEDSDEEDSDEEEESEEEDEEEEEESGEEEDEEEDEDEEEEEEEDEEEEEEEEEEDEEEEEEEEEDEEEEGDEEEGENGEHEEENGLRRDRRRHESRKEFLASRAFQSLLKNIGFGRKILRPYPYSRR